MSKKTILYFSLPFLLVLLLWFATRAPGDSPEGKTIKIAKGDTVSEVSETLGEARLIGMETLFKLLVRLRSPRAGVIAGDYFFSGRENLWQVVRRLVHGDFGLQYKKVTIPEGATAYEVGLLIARAVPAFDRKTFNKLAEADEGYLFPDTYFFSPAVTPAEAYATLRGNFETKTRGLAPLLVRSGHTLGEIVTMASLLEEEAKDFEQRRMISGILWRRIEEKMPLQVDAVFPYIIGKNTFQLTRADLATDSPYNTYKYAGLPPGPISNPGLEAIEAALEPIESDYLFYLSDLDGEMHYAVNFDEHVANKRKYLR